MLVAFERYCVVLGRTSLLQVDIIPFVIHVWQPRFPLNREILWYGSDKKVLDQAWLMWAWLSSIPATATTLLLAPRSPYDALCGVVGHLRHCVPPQLPLVARWRHAQGHDASLAAWWRGHVCHALSGWLPFPCRQQPHADRGRRGKSDLPTFARRLAAVLPAPQSAPVLSPSLSLQARGKWHVQYAFGPAGVGTVSPFPPATPPGCTRHVGRGGQGPSVAGAQGGARGACAARVSVGRGAARRGGVAGRAEREPGTRRPAAVARSAR